MGARLIPRTAIVGFLLCSTVCFAEDILFEDHFDKELSSTWHAVGLKKEDYRIRDGGIELRVQPGKWTRETPMLKVLLPFTTSNTVVASVDVTVLDEFTQDGEFAGLLLIADGDVVFTVKKSLTDGKLLFSPSKYEFVGKPGEEGTGSKYTVSDNDSCELFLPATQPRRRRIGYHLFHRSSGHLWRGRFKHFPIEDDEHLLTVIRYVERNPLRANLVRDVREWPWSSAGTPTTPVCRPTLDPGPVPRGSDWLGHVNRPLTQSELQAVRHSVERGTPFGSEPWVVTTARTLGLESTLRSRGRPRKN